MAEMEITEYQDYLRHIVGRKRIPHARTIIRHIESRKIWGKKDPGGRWVVDPDKKIEQTPSNGLEGQDMARRRLAKYRDLPANLIPDKKKSGAVYYRYRIPSHINVPENERWQRLGSDKAKAIDAANQLNQKYGIGADLVARVLASVDRVDRDVNRFIEKFLKEIIPARRIKGQPMSPSTISEYNRICTHFTNEWSGKRFPSKKDGADQDEISQADIAKYLSRQTTAEAANKHRTLLGVIFKYAISDGLTPENLALLVVPRDTENTKRHRLTLEGYKAIYAHAEPAIQSAMELSLNVLQRRADLQKWRFDDTRDGFVHVVISKTKNHGKESYIRVPVTLPLVHSERGCTTLQQLIASCRKDDIASPFLVHHKPGRKLKSKEKEHWTQLSPKQISDGFTRAAKASGFFNHMKAGERPTLHECIALGEHLHEKAGKSVQWIQVLRGHSSDKMTRKYLDGHEWTTVELNG